MKDILVFFLFSLKAFAHQPKQIYDSPTEENPYIIEYPEISKEFYGKLSRQLYF